jgi:hypothetical protein
VCVAIPGEEDCNGKRYTIEFKLLDVVAFLKDIPEKRTCYLLSRNNN